MIVKNAPKTVGRYRVMVFNMFGEKPLEELAEVYTLVTGKPSLVSDGEGALRAVLLEGIASRPAVALPVATRRQIATITGVMIAVPSDGRPAGYDTYEEGLI